MDAGPIEGDAGLILIEIYKFGKLTKSQRFSYNFQSSWKDVSPPPISLSMIGISTVGIACKHLAFIRSRQKHSVSRRSHSQVLTALNTAPFSYSKGNRCWDGNHVLQQCLPFTKTVFTSYLKLCSFLYVICQLYRFFH